MSDDFEPSAEELLANNVRYVEAFHEPGLELAPKRRLAIVACMDSRMNVFDMLGLGHGDAHIIRNAGGIVTDDVIRSLVLSQRLLGTREIILIHHTDCSLQKLTDDGFKWDLADEVGMTPPWSIETFRDPADDVRHSINRLRANPFVQHTEHVRGFVYDVDTGRLTEVRPVSPAERR